MSQSVLVLGAKGTLGQELVNTFTTAGYTVTAWDRENLDITAPEAKAAILSLSPNVILNATGYNAVDKAESDPAAKELAFALNTHAPEMLAEAAKELGAVFVNYSTDFVFKGDRKEGYLEIDEPNPVSAYGQSKAEGEKRVQAVGGKYYIIRLSRLFGKPGISEMSKKSFVDIMKDKQNLETADLVNEESGSPTYAPDLAQFTLSLIKDLPAFGIYHGANSGQCNWYEWALEIFRLLNSSVKVNPISGVAMNRPAERPQFSALVNTKRPAQRSWQEALQEYLLSQ